MPRNGDCKRLEKPIQKKILRLLQKRGAWAVKVMTANFNGCPDILCCYRGQFIAFEIKSSSGVPTPLQTYNIDKIHEADGVAHVVRNVEEVEIILQTLKGPGE